MADSRSILSNLPVCAVLPDIAYALAANRAVVLQAPPGSGKTTLVAPSLLDAPWLQGRRIILLEPRRLAARLAARFVADGAGRIYQRLEEVERWFAHGCHLSGPGRDLKGNSQSDCSGVTGEGYGVVFMTVPCSG